MGRRRNRVNRKVGYTKGMAKAKNSRKGPPEKYPWDRWFRPGARHVLQRDRDYKVSTYTMVVYLYQRAKILGRKISLSQRQRRGQDQIVLESLNGEAKR